MRSLLEDQTQSFDAMLGHYDPPQGRPEFITAVVKSFREKLGWNIGPENVAVSLGSQCGFFTLFNLLGGDCANGQKRKILIPLMPDYIGYADQGVCRDLFVSFRPTIEERDDHLFKYRVDFSRLTVNDDIAAIAVSRPTNPTGNVLTQNELAQLSDLAKKSKIPLIVDNAYGFPFPNIIFTDPGIPAWEEHLIYTFSLSKIGLPGTRTGVIIAAPEIVRAIEAANAVMSLANCNVGQALASELLTSGELIRASEQTIRPFYSARAAQALSSARDVFDPALPWRLHVCEGALFFWLWCKDLPITSQELYARLKRRQVLVVPGNYFFFGLEGYWRHSDECLRLNYSQDPAAVRRGFSVIGDELKQLYA